MDTHENIKKYRKIRGLSQAALAELTGYGDRSSIAKIESGSVDLPQSKIAAFANALGVSPVTLMGMNDASIPTAANIEPMPAMRKIPLLGTISCGDPILAAENVEEEVDIPEHIRADFALRCRGDSMIGAEIYDGDIVYIRQQRTVLNGQIAAVLIEDEATLKRFYYNEAAGRVMLSAENPDYEPLVYTGEELNRISVLGLAVGLTREI